MRGMPQRLLLHPRADPEFVPLHFQRVVFHTVAECLSSLHTVRQIRHISVRDAAAKALNTDQRPLRMSERAHHCKRVRKLRAEDMHDIRLEVLENRKETILERVVVDFRRVQVFMKSVENSAVHFHPAVPGIVRHRTADAKINEPRTASAAQPFKASGQPPFAVGIRQPAGFRESRKHDIA